MVSIPKPKEIPNSMENFLFLKCSVLSKRLILKQTIVIKAKSDPKTLEYLNIIGYIEINTIANIPVYLSKSFTPMKYTENNRIIR